MKTINQSFSDQEIKKLEKIKGDLSWHNFILIMAEHYFESKIEGGINKI